MPPHVLFFLLLSLSLVLFFCSSVYLVLVGAGVGVCNLNNGFEVLLLFCSETLEPQVHALE